MSLTGALFSLQLSQIPNSGVDQSSVREICKDGIEQTLNLIAGNGYIVD
jgi:hypothetical protein